MTIFYPDISGYQAGIDLAGAPAACCKATEGTSYVNPDYSRAKGNAASRGAYFFAYHFLHSGGGAAQADHCLSVTGGLPVMIDAETTGSSNPTVPDIAAFCDRYRARGGTCNLVYLPHWYWVKIGSPSLAPLASRGLKLVSSRYTSYSDSGPGWAGYGGMTVAVWQFSASYSFNGRRVDFNAFKGTVAQFKSVVSGGGANPVPTPAPTPESQVLRLNDTGPAVGYLQKRLNVWGAAIAIDNAFGPLTEAAVRAFQTGAFGAGPDVDGVVGPKTWAALDKTPPPAPSGNWTFGPLREFAVIGAVTNAVAVQLTSPNPPFIGTPAGAPGIDHYDIVVRDGAGRDVARHAVDKGKPTQVFQVDGLDPGTPYKLLGRACLADGSHSAPWSVAAAHTVG